MTLARWRRRHRAIPLSFFKLLEVFFEDNSPADLIRSLSSETAGLGGIRGEERTSTVPVNVKAIAPFARLLIHRLWEAVRDLLPIVVVVVGFQTLVLRQPFPDVAGLLVGTAFVIVGLMLFVQGLELGLFPIGEAMAHSFARKGSLAWLLVFGFLLGFSTTIAEPALIAIADEASDVVADAGLIGSDEDVRAAYALQLRLTVAVSVGCAILIGVFRILKGWPVHLLIIAGYIIVVAMTFVAPNAIVGIAFDSGGVTTSTVTVPLVTALGVGLAASIRGRDPLIDGFGMIALASLTPMIFVMLFGIVRFGIRASGSG